MSELTKIDHAEENQPFVTAQELFELLEEQDLHSIFGFTKQTPFLVEVAFLENWNLELGDGPNQDGVDIEVYQVQHDNANCFAAQICIQYDENGEDETIYLNLTTDGRRTGQYALEIIRNDNLVYARTIDQDPATQWMINSMAGDSSITDIAGNILFVGDTTNL